MTRFRMTHGGAPGLCIPFIISAPGAPLMSDVWRVRHLYYMLLSTRLGWQYAEGLQATGSSFQVGYIGTTLCEHNQKSIYSPSYNLH
jgi:hypothetical protein